MRLSAQRTKPRHNDWRHQFEAKRRPGGASRDRTDDPLLAKQVLSQLSYGPKLILPWAKLTSNAQ
jgi:hypothetical protein